MRNSGKVILSLCDYSGEWAKPWIDEGYCVMLVDPKHDEFSINTNPMKLGYTAQDFLDRVINGNLRHLNVVGILAAPPCTDFAGSGSRWWKDEAKIKSTEDSLEIVDACLELVKFFEYKGTLKFWALENPVGRLRSLRPELGKPWYFNPVDYSGYNDWTARDHMDHATIITQLKNTGDMTREQAIRVHELNLYTKKTGIWGDCDQPVKHEKYPAIYLTTSTGKKFSPLSFKTGGKSAKTKELRSNTPAGFAKAFFEANEGRVK